MGNGVAFFKTCLLNQTFVQCSACRNEIKIAHGHGLMGTLNLCILANGMANYNLTICVWLKFKLHTCSLKFDTLIFEVSSVKNSLPTSIKNGAKYVFLLYFMLLFAQKIKKKLKKKRIREKKIKK